MIRLGHAAQVNREGIVPRRVQKIYGGHSQHRDLIWRGNETSHTEEVSSIHLFILNLGEFHAYAASDDKRNRIMYEKAAMTVRPDPHDRYAILECGR
jgi:hypothetical protein